jgi:hypothetical protein
MYPIVSVAIVLLLLSAPEMAIGAQRFEDFPTDSWGNDGSGKIILHDTKSRQYANLLREAATHKPNFAGHYIFASWGCGTSCIMSAAIDTKTGAVEWLPFTVCCWDASVAEPIDFRLNSRLLIIRGSRNETGSGVYFYEFNRHAFLMIESEEDTDRERR